MTDTGEPFHLSLWGGFQVRASATGEDLTPRGRKARALFAYLALHPGKDVRRERVAALLWSDRGEVQARASLRQVLVELRPLQPLLQVTRQSLKFRSSLAVTDVKRIVALAESGGSEALLQALPDADEQPLADLDGISDGYEEWLSIERTRQRDRLATTVAGNIAKAKASGDKSEAALTKWLQSFDPSWEGQVPRVPPSPSEKTALEGPIRLAPNRHFRAYFAGLAVAVLIIAGIWWLVRDDRPAAGQSSVAVLPFQSLSSGRDAYLADGISEEIMTRLSQNPQQRVIGRTSAWSFRGKTVDAQAIGTRLGVDYLVEGSVRSAGPSLRVDVALIQVRDGTRLWTERFEGNRNDVFALQDRIGRQISGRLGSELPNAIRPTNRGMAYELVLTARGLLRARERAKFDAAIALLQRAVAMDPNYAGALATLGRALIYESRNLPDSPSEATNSPEALSYIHRAIALQPNLAEAHFALGLAPGPTNRRLAELRKAVELDPGYSEAWFTLSRTYRVAGDYRGEYLALRKSFALDPLWFRAFYGAAEVAWELGRQNESEAIVRKSMAGFPHDDFEGRMQQADVHRRRGDYSGALAAAEKAAVVAPRGRRFFADLARARAYRAAGDFERVRQSWPYYLVDGIMWRMWHNVPPSPADVETAIRDPKRGAGEEDRAAFMLVTLINSRRHAEIVKLFDARFGSPGQMAASDLLSDAGFLRQAILFSLALAERGQVQRAGELRTLADRSVSRVLKSGFVPNWYWALCAQHWAAQGKPDQAIDALLRAVRQGWRYSDQRDSFADIATEPAFASLLKDPRFVAIRSRLNAHVARERSEMPSN